MVICQFNTLTLHMNISRAQVRSRPLDCLSISGRFQVSRQNDVLTNCCQYWLRWTVHTMLTWKETSVELFYVPQNGWMTTCKHFLYMLTSVFHIYLYMSVSGPPGQWRHHTESSGTHWVSLEASWSLNQRKIEKKWCENLRRMITQRYTVCGPLKGLVISNT